VFGFPEHFTDVGNLQPRQRQALLGKAWSVDVMLRILEPLKAMFPAFRQ
jgi:DNA (cytosine-5)-methyltransferase 3A